MKILSIETSCDETAISLMKVKSDTKGHHFKILGNELSSQIALHTQYGGVFPMMAKREHDKNILPILIKVLKEAKLYKLKVKPKQINNLLDKNDELKTKEKNKILKILEREEFLRENFVDKLIKIKKPDIDAIAITTGPGLVPALWVGISFAKALSVLWDIPLVPVNHMEGHIFSIFPKKGKSFNVKNTESLFPALSLLVSGGHTELILIKDWMKYKKIGQTRDDAVGEAFDKVARMLGLPYPGGPEISRLAKEERNSYSDMTEFSGPQISSPIHSFSKTEAQSDHENLNNPLPLIKLPRPMIYTKDYDFSFSGLKTAVLYMIRNLGKLNDNMKREIAREFEDSAIEVLVHKTIKAIKEYKIKTLIVGGGVSANSYLQEQIQNKINEINKNLSKARPYSKTKVYFPSKTLTGDNAQMIAIAGYFQYKNKKYTKRVNTLKANGNLSL